MPGDTFSHTAVAASGPDAVWATLQHAATWQGLGVIDDVHGEVRDDGRLRSFRWTATVAGTRHDGHAVVTAAEEGRSMTLALDTDAIAGELVVTLAPDGDGSTLSVTLAARSRSMLAGMFWGVVADALRRGLPQQVERFAATF